MAVRRPLLAGNWKMNGLRANLSEIAAICDAQRIGDGAADIVLCPPATLLSAAAALCGDGAMALGGQDCHAEPDGPHTGDISAEMLRDAGASYVIVGHSERRINHGEPDAVVRAKAAAGLRAGLTVILCVGESRAEREAGKAMASVAAQLAQSLPEAATPDRLVVAYEPTWAIGTGAIPTTADVAAMHGALRAEMAHRLHGGEAVRILYGGSVKPGNAGALLGARDVDGALVGGASLKAAEFLAIAAFFKTAAAG